MPDYLKKRGSEVYNMLFRELTTEELKDAFYKAGFTDARETLLDRLLAAGEISEAVYNKYLNTETKAKGTGEVHASE
jgi:uncharacterized protein (DUF2164 family)